MTCVLILNDTPDRHHGHSHYYEEDSRHVVAVSFVAANGRSIRVSFDPQTGDISTCELEG